MDYLKITNLEVFAHHGVFPEETRDGQNFYVNAKLFLDCSRAGKTDDLCQSVNYGEVCQFITKFLQENTYKLIEAATENTVKKLLLEFPLIEKVEFELCKPHAPIGLPFENVSVTIERGWHQAFVAVGSNMGDSRGFIEMAMSRLKEDDNIKSFKASELIVTKPYGGVEQDDFLNGAFGMQTLYSPEELLKKLHEIEQEANRKREIHWGPRTLDLDIIFYDRLVYESHDLIIPHVDMQNRDFVLKPMVELAPNFRHPVLNKTMTELLGELD